MSATQQSEVSEESVFQSRLRSAMKRNGLSADALSNATNGAISPRSVFRWLSGESEPGVGAMRVLCPVLKVSSDWLLGLEQ